MPYGKCVSYSIRGTHDAKGVNDAIKSMQRLKKAGEVVNAAFKGLVVGTVIKGIHMATNGATEAFIKQNKALTQFNAIVTKSNLNLKEMTEIRSKMSRDNLFDDDTLNNAMSMATQMGLNEKQIEKVMNAATDMASSGIMPLDQAVKSLSMTYGGNIGQLTKMYPELQNVTKQELEQGKAVDVLAKKYEGMSNAMANTFSGRDSQFKNNLSDLKAAVGSIMQEITFISQGAMMEPLKKTTEWIKEHKTQIVNFITKFPEICKVVLKEIWEMIKYTFTGEGIQNLLTFLGQAVVNQSKFAMNSIFGLAKTLGKDILKIFDYLLGNLWRNTKDLIGNIGNNLIDTINEAFKTLLSTPGIKQLYEWLSGNSVTGDVITFRFNTNNSKDNLSWSSVTSSIANNNETFIQELKEGFADFWDKETKILEGFGIKYEQFGKRIVDGVAGVVAEGIPKGMVDTIIPDSLKEKIIEYFENFITVGEITPWGKNVYSYPKDEDRSAKPIGVTISEFIENLKDKFQGFGKEIKESLGSFGQLGQVIKLIMSSNIVGLLVQFIVSLSNSLANQSESWSKLLNCMSTVTDVIAEIIGPIWEKIIKPVVTGLESIGTIIGNLILPILEIIGSILEPVGNVFNEILARLAEFIVGISPLLQIIVRLTDIFVPIIPLLNVLCNLLVKLMDIFRMLYNKILVPIINGIISMFIYVGNVFVWIYKQIYAILSWIKLPTSISIGWSGISVGWSSLASMVGMGDASYISAGDYLVQELGDGGANTLSSSSSTSTAGGASASYTAARDIYVTINYNNSYVNGDARQIALNLRDEIRSAERLGL